MKKLLRYMSPFAPDQSGASGVLYELGGIIVICDAGGCAGNICGFDEPRWFTKKSAVFSAGLRDMDAIMGRDDRLIQKTADAHSQLQTPFVSIIGTPVPAVIGTDMRALKRMAEGRMKVPCITVECTGTRYYDEGERDTWTALFKEFAGHENDTDYEDCVGIIGATPLETGYSTEEPLIEMCRRSGIESPIIYSRGGGLKDLKNAHLVSRNIVVSLAGVEAAEYMERTYGVPYEIDYPFIPESIIAAAEQELTDNVLIIHSQINANRLRDILSADGRKIDCATWFMQDAKYMQDGDYRLAGEDDLLERLEERGYSLIIADGDTERLLRAGGYTGAFVEYPHFAISGQLFDDGKTLYNENDYS